MTSQPNPGAMVDVGAGELRTSRERLLKQAQAAESVGDTAVGGLLYFYAAECALKAEVMRRRSLYVSTAQLALRPTEP